MSENLKVFGQGNQPLQQNKLQIQINDSFNGDGSTLFQSKQNSQQRKHSMPVLKQQSHFDCDKSNMQTTQILELNSERSQFKINNGEFKQSMQRKSTNLDSSERYLLSQISSFRSQHHSPLNDKTLYNQFSLNTKRNIGNFESLNEIGQRLKLQYHGNVSTPQSGSARSSKNSIQNTLQQKNNLTYSAQNQLNRDSSQNSQDQYHKKIVLTPKVKTGMNQNFSLFQSPQSSRFYQQSFKDQSDSFKLNTQQFNHPQDLHIDLKFLAENSTTQVLNKNAPKEKKADVSKQNWGRPITEQKQRFVSLDQANINDIQFENKKDEEQFLKKNVPLFNKNFLGIQLALNNKTCLKKLLVTSNNSNETKNEDQYQQYSKNYRNQRLQNLIFNNSSSNNNSKNFLQEQQPSQINQITKKIFGQVFPGQKDSPYNSSQSANSPSYSEAFFKNSGSYTAKFSSNERQSENQAAINIGGFSTTTHRFYNQKSDQSLTNKWKYKQNIQDKNIAQTGQPKNSNFNETINNHSSNQIFLQNNFTSQKQLSQNLGQKLSSSLLSCQKIISPRSSHNLLLQIHQIDGDDTNHLKSSQHRISIKAPSDSKLDKQQQRSQKNTSIVLENSHNDHDISFEQQNQMKFTKISEENENILNDQNSKFTSRYNELILSKRRSKSSYQQSLQKQISKQIGIDLKKCMPQKMKIDTFRKQSHSYDHRGQKLFTKTQIQVCFDEIQKQMTQKIQHDYQYKLMISETELNQEQFIERLLIFISYCLNQNLVNSSLNVSKSHKQLQPKSLIIAAETQIQSQHLQYKSQENKLQQQVYQSSQQTRAKIKSNGAFRLSTSSQQTLKNIFSDLAIPFQFQQMLIDDIIEIFKQRVSDNNALSIFQEHLKRSIQTILMPKQIIQEIGGKLNAKRIFTQAFEHLEEVYFVNKQSYLNDNHSNKDENDLNLYKTGENLILDYIISLINNEIRSFDSEKNIIQFSNLHFFFFKLSIQSICLRQGLTQKQTFYLLEKIEQNRDNLCNSDQSLININDFAQKRQLASELLHQDFMNYSILNEEQKNISNSFILLETIIDFINNKIKCQQFTYFIQKKFQPESLQNGLLSKIFHFAKTHIFPAGLKQYQDNNQPHPLQQQFKRKIQFIQDENCSQIPPSQLWPFEQKEKIWKEMFKKIKGTSLNSTLSNIKEQNQISNDYTQFQQKRSVDINNNQLQKQAQNQNITNQEEVKPSKLSKDAFEQETDVFNVKQQLIKLNTSHSQSNSLCFLKYIYDFAFSFFDIFSAIDIQAAKNFYQINTNIFDQWMDQIKNDSSLTTRETLNQQISYLKKYSLLY
ncbi:hypothetical protein TTHERM_00318630 (macronuclear) [Tetrahymena thermophila SB210]|uniref:Uncharacterized protein n=1 Tax=Tetrahymena thermophila (strain SB210) TaxID=312017 RepID=I7LW94_TETTS|nr:hypothetical protein TTHERM_00318630 [Tetrahymena thermophila SB210]EAS01200.2 hypothetical protein TTHERM_00318630 [Tetrahymena thermophila SB210]|eukprot:XP_001021445.2 hypothetical protein TTHERM_00318630 [Tetrahymena thermophila SB210]